MSDTAATVQKDASSHEFTNLQQWQVAFIYAFAATFNQHHEASPSYHKLPDFTPQDLEDEIQKEESELIHQIICACLGNILNRSKPIESFKISLQQLLTDKIKLFEIDLQVNPLLKRNYNALPIDIKLYILHSMVEWQLQDSSAVKIIIDTYYQQHGHKDSNPIIAHPVGIDSKKHTYWQFGGSSWIWRESSNTKPSGSQWETVSKNLQDLEQLVDSFSESTSKAEKALVNSIKENVYKIAVKEEQRKLRKERAELRKLIPVEVSITPTTLRSRGNRSQRINYNFDDIYGIDDEVDDDEDDDESFEDEDDVKNSNDDGNGGKRQRMKKSPSPQRPPPTRWSSRLNRGATRGNEDVAKSQTESMEVDSQSLETTSLASDHSSDLTTFTKSSSFMDITPIESAEDTAASSNNAMNANDSSNRQIARD